MKTGASQGGTGTPMRVVLVIAIPTAPAARSGAPRPAQAAAHSLVGDAMRKAAQSSPAAQAAFRRNPAAQAKIAGHAQNLAARSPRSPLTALKQGLGVSSGLRTIAREMRKDFRKPGGQGGDAPGGRVKIAHSHPLSERGQRHAAAAERGLRRGGLGLLSAAWHGTRILSEQRKTLNRERADARAEARAAGKPAPPEGMRALLGSAVHGVGIARGLRAGLSEMRAHDRARTQTGGDARRPQAPIPTDGGARGRADTHGGPPPHGSSSAQRVLHATGFALGVMAFAHDGGDAQRTPQAALGLLLMSPRRGQDEEAQA